MLDRRLLPIALLFIQLAGSVRALAQPASDDVLELTLERQGGRLDVRALLDSPTAGVQGLSFAICHSTGDVLLESAEPGAALRDARGGAGADFISIQPRQSQGSGFVTLAAIVDFSGSETLGAGSNEVLAATYGLRPGGSGGSIRFCEAGNPVVRAVVSRGGQSFTPQIKAPGNSVRIEDALDAPDVAGATVFLTTEEEGFTGATLVICGGTSELGFSGLEFLAARTTPELLPFEPRLPAPVISGEAVRFSLSLGKPLPRVTALPILKIDYLTDFQSIGENFPITFCRSGTLGTSLSFGSRSIVPELIDGSIRIEVLAPATSFSIRRQEPGMDQDPIPLVVEGDFDSRDFIRGFTIVIAFDPTLLEVVDEPGVEDHRGDDVAVFLAAKAPLLENRRDEEGFFIYQIDFGPGNAAPGGSLGSLARFRLSRKTIPLPGGGAGKASGARVSLEFAKFQAGPGLTIENSYLLFLDDLVFDLEPENLSGAAFALGAAEEAAIRLRSSDAAVEIFEPAEITVSIEAPAGGIAAIRYSLSHSSAIAGLSQVADAPGLAALNPVSSVHDLREDGFTHTVILDPARPIGPAEGFALARATYEPRGDAGQSAPLEFGPEGPVVSVSRGGELLAVLPQLNLNGMIRLTEDPTLLAYRASSLRAPPGSEVEVAIFLDTGVAGIPGLQGSLCHDPEMAALLPSYLGLFPLGQDSVHLGADLRVADRGNPPKFHVLNPGRGPDGETGALFAAALLDTDERLPAGRGLEIFRVGYRLTGRYGEVLPIEFCALSAGTVFDPGRPLIDNIVTSSDLRSVPVFNQIPGSIILTDDLAPAISPAASPADLRGVAVTEFGWRWGWKAGSTALLKFTGGGDPFGAEIALPAVPRRLASGGEGWLWVSLPGEVAIVRFDRIEKRVPVGGEPYGIAVAPDRTAWVAVAGSEGKLLRLARDGRVLAVALLGPIDREPRDLAIDEEGAIWVTQEGRGVASRVAPAGAVIRRAAALLRSARPAGIVADGRGGIWISDAGDRSLLGFDLQGRERRRVALAAEPTDVSMGGSGALWTALEGGGELVRVLLGENDEQVLPVGPSTVRHGDRTGLLSLQFLHAGEDSDEDGIANAIEIREGTDPLNAADPPAGGSVPPVEKLSARVISVKLPGAGPGGGQLGTENAIGVSWENAGDYTAHEISIDGQPLAAPVSGEATSAVLEQVPPGPATVSVRSFIDAGSSPPTRTSFLLGPGSAVRSVTMGLGRPAGVAIDGVRGRIYVLDDGRKEVAVFDGVLQPAGRFPVPLPLGDPAAVLAGIAFIPLGDPGGGNLLVLDGPSGRYQEITSAGVTAGGPWEIPFSPPGTEVRFSSLAAGSFGGGPAVFALAVGPQNDCIIAFRKGSQEPAVEIPHPLPPLGAGKYALGGIGYHPGPGAGRLWLATGLEGETLARLVIDVPLDGSPSTGKVLLSVFDQPSGAPQVLGIAISPEKGDLLVATSDQGLHLLSDFGVVRGGGALPVIDRVTRPGGAPASGPTAGATELVVEGRNFGGDLADLRALVGERAAVNQRLESGGGLDRLHVLTPPGEGPGPVPVFLFRTRALDFLSRGFTYCDLDPAASPDCDADGIPDPCQLPSGDCDGDGALDACQLAGRDCNNDRILDVCQLAGNDCNQNGVLDGCDIRSGTSRDADGNGVPDECGGAVTFDREDPNGDGSADISDPIFVLGFLFLGEPPAIGCHKAADCNDDGGLDVSDPICLLGHLFLGLAPPAAPAGRCGADPTADPLSCESYPRCNAR